MFQIAGKGDGQQLIDDVRLWERELSASEVNAVVGLGTAAAVASGNKDNVPLCPVESSSSSSGGGSGGEPRCVWPSEDDNANTTVKPTAPLTVRMLSNKIAVVVTDPTQYVSPLVPLVNTILSVLTTFPICYAICIEKIEKPPYNNRKCGCVPY